MQLVSSYASHTHPLPSLHFF